jgi:NAD-dependent DNA ligase
MPKKSEKSEKIKKNKRNKVTKKMKKFIILTSSSSSLHLCTSKTPTLSADLTGKSNSYHALEKCEGVKKSENIPNIKTDLKASQELKINMSSRFNEQFIELMEKLANIMLKHGEPFRAKAYQKAQETIMAYPDDILSPDDLKGKPGIGSTIMEKLNEYVETGTLKILEREKNNPVNILTDIYGIGPKKAKDLVDAGITSISQLRENQQLLNDVQKVGLKYYEDVLKRIPREEIERYKKIFGETFEKVATPNSQFEIVGSYRRGAETSGDIDLIITSNNPLVFKNFIDNLVSLGIIEKVLSRGPTKCLVIAKLQDSQDYRRIDFLYTNPEEFPFAILYFTGSKIFNTVMRHKALEMGYTMNEHGLYVLEENGKKKGNKVDHTFHSERDIFDFLNMEYKNPVERIDGRAVVNKTMKGISSSSSNSEFIMQVKKPANKTLKKKANISEKPTKKSTKKLIIENNFDSDSDSDSEKEKKEEKEVVKIINNFKKNGISVIEGLNENQLSSILREANKAYYNEDPLMTDNEYDIVKDFVDIKYPNNQVVLEIGAPVERNKVTLPYLMGSMDKIKPDTTALSNWTKKYKGPYVLSCKLDGVSGLYTTEGKSPKLYTRGDGKVGQDISHLIPYLRLPKTKNIVIRGEFIIPKSLFETKYKTKFANPRNMVAGIVNHKTINDTINDLHFVAYEVIIPNVKPSEQMSLLSTFDVEVVMYEVKNEISNELLSTTLVQWRQNYLYEIDGVIVSNDAVYERKSGNPDYAFAFKMVLSDQIAEAKVVDVIWSPSKDGYLKPRVQIEPINLGGVRIEYATGFNGAFIYDNKIGIGSIVELIRSGDVIPHIRKVTVPAEEPKMPSVPYKWNDTHVDVLLENIETDETVKEKVITGFFKGLGVESLGSGNVARIINAGFDTVPKILKMTVNDFLSVEGFKDKTATKLYNGIKERIQIASLVTIMSASNLFGRGFSEKKLELIINAYPNILTSHETNLQKIEKISSIKGMAKKSAEAFVERISDFIHFIEEAGLNDKFVQNVVIQKVFDESHPLFGKTIVMTGFRDASIQDVLKDIGAKLGSSVSKNTFVVLVKNIDEDTGKAAEAKKIGVPLMTPEEFKEKYVKTI